MGFRSDNSGFFAGADKVGTFLFSNFIWVVLSMTLIGIPFASVGLTAMMNDWVRGLQPEFFRIFAGTIREQWRKTLIIGAIDLAIGGLIWVNFSIFQVMELDNVLAVLSRAMTFCVAIVFISTNMYLIPMISLLDISVKNLIKLSLILVLTYPVRSFGLTALLLVPVIVGFFLPIAFFLFLLVSVTAYIASWGTWNMLQHHFPPLDLEALLLKPLPDTD